MVARQGSLFVAALLAVGCGGAPSSVASSAVPDDARAAVSEEAGAGADGAGGSDAATVPCVAVVYFADEDGDGFGGAALAPTCGPAPAGSVTNASDCDDGDARAFPGQTAYFATPRASGSFDFNCDGSEEVQYQGASCAHSSPVSMACAGTSGFGGTETAAGVVGSLPTCGQTGVYTTCAQELCLGSGNGCGFGPCAFDASNTTLPRIPQGCR